MKNSMLIKFKEEIETQGYSIIKNVLSPEYINKAKLELEKAIHKESLYHKNKNYKDYGMVLLCSLYHKIFSDIFDFPLFINPFETILGKGCIVYAYTSSSMPPNKTNYSSRIHVDCPRIIPNYITNLGATILLDDFTEKNGATSFLPFSQTQKTPPTKKTFQKDSFRLIEKAGSVCFFNARLWHCGNINYTKNWRHALTINMVRPWMKQRIDIPRAMANTKNLNLSENAKQKLGFYSQIPANYDEYYLPKEQRKFKQEIE